MIKIYIIIYINNFNYYLFFYLAVHVNNMSSYFSSNLLYKLLMETFITLTDIIQVKLFAKKNRKYISNVHILTNFNLNKIFYTDKEIATQ